MNSNEPNKKCIMYLKMKGWISSEIDNFESRLFIKNKYEDLIWYIPKYNLWNSYTRRSIKLKDKLNELQQAK